MVDAVSYSAAQIKAKASAYKAKTFVSLASTKRLPADLPSGPRPTSVISKRDTYLKSINAWALKQAASDMGFKLRFNSDGTKWEEDNAQLKDALPQIRAAAAELVAQKKAAAEIVAPVDIEV